VIRLKVRFFRFLSNLNITRNLKPLGILVSLPWKKQFEDAFENHTDVSLVRISEGKNIFNEELYSILKILLCNLDAKQTHQIKSAHAINNPFLMLLFENSLKLIASKHTDTRSLFQREDWKKKPDHEFRREILTTLGDYVSSFRKLGWNTGQLVTY